MNFDPKTARKGDKVTVHGVIDCITLNGATWVDMGLDLPCPINPDRIATHEPQPREFKPGDRVTWGAGVRVYEFIAQRGGAAIVWSRDYGPSYPNISELRHADESE